MFELPTEVDEFKDLMPARTVLISHAGTGKTTALSLLPNCLLLDLEGGSQGYGGLCFNLKKKKEEWNMKNPTNQLTDVGAWNFFIHTIKEANKQNRDFVYDFLGVDTLTAMQVIAEQMATSNFNKSVIGQGMAKKRDGELVKSVITELADGAGYMWLFDAWETMLRSLEGLVKKGVVFMGHTKQGSLLKNGQNISAKDIDLTGKLKQMLLRDVQASGTLYRSDTNTVKVSFVSDERDLTTKSRCAHLANKEFTFSSLNEKTGELTVYWNIIYPDWFEQPIVTKIRNV